MHSQQLADGLVKVIRQAIDQRLDTYAAAQSNATVALVSSLAVELSRSLEEMVDKKLADRGFCDSYKGVWRDGQSYTRNDLVTHQGSLWACFGPTFARPGTPDSAWKLIVKKGKDAHLTKEQ
jgi:hypothetical protein